MDHSKLENLKEMGIPDNLTCLLRNLYADKETAVRTRRGTMDLFKSWKGVQQGWILSTCVFKFCAKYIMGNAGLYESQAGIKTASRNIDNLSYADGMT